MASSTVIASPHKRLLDRHTQKKLAGIGRVIMILLIMIIVVLPFYVAVLYSFRAPDAITANRLAWPEHPTFQNYLRVIFENESFLTGYKNSIINTLPTVVLLMVITSMASWVLARHETRFYNFMYAILTLGLLIPFQCFELPLYINWYNAGLVSTNIGFIVARAGLQISISLTAVTGFIKTVPRDLEQAAMMDGLQPVPVLLEGGLPPDDPHQRDSAGSEHPVYLERLQHVDYSASQEVLLHPDVGTDHLLQREYDHAERGVCLLHHGHDPNSDPLSVHAEIHCQRHHRWCGQGLIPTVWAPASGKPEAGVFHNRKCKESKKYVADADKFCYNTTKKEGVPF